MARDVDLAKRIYSYVETFGGTGLKNACLAAARDILGRSEDGKRDLLFEALCTAMGADWKAMPKHEAAKYNVATQQLREIHATPAEVAQRARRYEFLHPDWPLTPTALISHWSTLTAGKATMKKIESIAREMVEEQGPLVGPPPEFMAMLKGGGLKSMKDGFEHLTTGLSPDTLVAKGPKATPPHPETRNEEPS